jgi:chloramphenicol-sensitive protein RarD
VWSLAFILIVLAITRRWNWMRQVFRQPAAYGRYLVTAVLLAINYGVYIWANNSGHLVEASLGYFINPLVNVLLGMVFLHERLRRLQAAAVIVALFGVVYLTVDLGRLPWVALTLALTFGTYSLLRKTGKLGSIEGSTLEMLLLFIPSVAYLSVVGSLGSGALGRGDAGTTLLLLGAGAATAAPMLLFNYGARYVTMITLGLLQYIAPTLQFLIGVFLFGEPFDETRLIGFLVIWAALAIYWIEGFAQYRRRSRTQMEPI